AVAFGERRLTYGELDASANRLARHLADLGVGRGAMVGLAVERSPEMVVGALAILKAGGAYVPLDPRHPAERLAAVLDELGAGDVLVAVTTLAFDIAGLELWLPLTRGAQVVVADADTAHDGARLAGLLAAAGATVLQATPASWRMLVDAGWRGDERLTALC